MSKRSIIFDHKQLTTNIPKLGVQKAIIWVSSFPSFLAEVVSATFFQPLLSNITVYGVWESGQLPIEFLNIYTFYRQESI